MSGLCFNCVEGQSSLIGDQKWKDIEKKTSRIESLDFYNTQHPQNHPFIPDILHRILVYLPTYNLFSSSILVCKYWYATIHTDAFFRNFYKVTFKTTSYPRWRGVNLKQLFVKEHYMYKHMVGIGDFRIGSRFSFNVYIVGGKDSGKTDFLSIVENGTNEGGEYVFSKGVEDDVNVTMKLDREKLKEVVATNLEKGEMEVNFFGKEKIEHVVFKLLEDEMFIVLIDMTNRESLSETLFTCIRIKYEITNSFVILVETKGDSEDRQIEDVEVQDLVNRKIVDDYGYVDHHVKLNLNESTRENIEELMYDSIKILLTRDFPRTKVLELDDDPLFE